MPRNSQKEPLGPDNVDEVRYSRRRTGAPKTNNTALPLEFITLTSRPATQKSDFSYTVRSHAMQSYLQKKKSTKAENEGSISKAGPKAENKSAEELSGKFKLESWSRKKPRKRSPGRNVKYEEISDDSPLLSGHELLLYSSGGQSLKVDRSDAYGALPITMSSRTQSLLYHYNTGFTVNAFAINYDETWKPFSISDSALLHATLCLVAQHEDLIRGSADSSDSLYHKGQAMKLINTRLLDDKHRMTDASITSVAVLVILEAMNGTFEAATAHQVGLMKMVKLRGGVCNLNHNPVLLRVVAWSDIIYSTRWGSPLKFRTFHTQDTSLVDMLSQNFNLQILQEHDYVSNYAEPEISDIFQSIQIISAAMDLPDLSMSNKKTLSESLYTAEHRLLSLEDTQSASESSSSPISHAFTVAALLYLQIFIREVPSMSKVHHRLVSKLQVFLEEHDMGSFDYSGPPYGDVLLWIAFVKAAASPLSGPSDGIWLTIEGWTKEGLRATLMSVAWRGRKCDPILDRIWSSFTEA